MLRFRLVSRLAVLKIVGIKRFLDVVSLFYAAGGVPQPFSGSGGGFLEISELYEG